MNVETNTSSQTTKEPTKICIFCGTDNQTLVDVNSEELANDFPNTIEQYLPIKLEEFDNLSLQCCWDCVSTISSWHTFVQKTTETSRQLRVLNDKSVREVQESENRDDILPSSTTSLYAFCLYDENEINTKSISETYEKHDEDLTKSEGENVTVNDPVHSCHFCTETFQTEEDVLNHTNDKHTEIINEELPKRQKLRCKIDQTLINEAKIIVDDRVYYNCKECGKSLLSPYTYLWHTRIHTGERPYVCDLCGKQFRVSQGLVRHLKETHERIKNFACDICGRMFATKRNVDEHRRIHTNERPYVCALCGKAFKQKASLFVHNRTHSDTFPFRCEYCDQGFRSRAPLLVHVTKHTGQKPYPCEICGRRFRIKYELKRHKLVHSEEKPFACSLCELSFKQKRYLRNHFKVSHGNRYFHSLTLVPSIQPKRTHTVAHGPECPVIELVYVKNPQASEAENFKEKQEFSTNETKKQENPQDEIDHKYVCDFCNVGFTRAYDKERHIKRKHPRPCQGKDEKPKLDVNEHKKIKIRRRKNEIDRNFICDYCDIGYSKKYDLNRHMRLKHPDVEPDKTGRRDYSNIWSKCAIVVDGKKMYECDVCKHRTNKPYHLVRHRTIHSDTREYVCEICGLAFRLQYDLRRHMKQKHLDKTLKCEICDRAFSFKSTLDEHTLTHTDHRRYSCDICPKSFKQKASLYVHKKYHTDKFDFNCLVCDKKFRRLQELHVHNRTHTGEKPYGCDICGMRFARTQVLRKHEKIHDRSGGQWACPDCQCTFTEERYLKLHKRIHITEQLL